LLVLEGFFFSLNTEHREEVFCTNLLHEIDTQVYQPVVRRQKWLRTTVQSDWQEMQLPTHPRKAHLRKIFLQKKVIRGKTFIKNNDHKKRKKLPWTRFEPAIPNATCVTTSSRGLEIFTLIEFCPNKADADDNHSHRRQPRPPMENSTAAEAVANAPSPNPKPNPNPKTEAAEAVAEA